MTTLKKHAVHILITICVLFVGLLGMRTLTSSKKEVKRAKPTVQPPMVRTMEVRAEERRIRIHAEGTVRPVQEVNLIPQVSGEVTYVSPALTDGGEFRKGDLLLQIDPRDYELAITLAEAGVKDAQTHLELMEQEAEAAREEWKRHSGNGNGNNLPPPRLVAKEPQLTAARARLSAARAELAKARLALERTRIRAPFAGRVSHEQVDIGQYVAPGASLATLYSTGTMEIVLPLENEKLRWFEVPGFTSKTESGAPATVYAVIAGEPVEWAGQVVRSQGRLDERTRMVNVVVQVEDPYIRRPPLVPGLFVEVEITGQALSDAAVIPRSTLHENDVVWIVNEENRIVFRPVDVALIQGDHVVIRTGLATGERLVLTPLKTATDGMQVRIAPPEEAHQELPVS
jgi:RND family efflux transporter MFP subunit